MFISSLIFGIVTTSKISNKRKNTSLTAVNAEKCSRIDRLDKQDSILSDFLTADTGLFLINENKIPTDNPLKTLVEGDVHKEHSNSEYDTQNLVPLQTKAKEIKSSVNIPYTSNLTLDNTLDSFQQEQIKKQATFVYENVSKQIVALKSGHVFYRQCLDSIKDLSLSFEKLTLSDELPKSVFCYTDMHLLFIMKEFMSKITKHIVKLEELDIFVLNNSAEMHQILSTLVLKIRSLSEFYRENINQLGNCVVCSI